MASTASAPVPVQHLKLDNTLGAALLGNIIAGILYGITCLQTFVYYKRGGKDDCRFFRMVIYGLWTLDTLHLALVTHALYFYLIQSYVNPLALLHPNWSILSQVYVTCASDLIVRIIYGRRVWKFSSSIILAILIAVTSAGAFGGGLAFTTKAFIDHLSFEGFAAISYWMYIALGSSVAADILIACATCLSLMRSRTGFKRTDSIVTVLMVYVINSSLLTTVCAAACFITYTIWPHNFAFIGIYFCLSKLFFNSLLAMLNGRTALKKRINRLSDTPFHFSQASTRIPDFRTSYVPSRNSMSLSAKGSPVTPHFSYTPASPNPLLVAVNTHIQVSDES